MNNLSLRERFGRRFFMSVAVAVIVLGSGMVSYATHSWGSYHWARSSQPLTLKLGDNVSSKWDTYLIEASSDWNQSSILTTSIVAGKTNPTTCKATSGRVEVCSAKYGKTGWLGVAQIWVSGDHITKGTAKMNDTYFSTSAYNTPAWRRLVMCQEIAHTFGLDHQDEDFYNANLGTCMDYTADPDGPLSNEHPNLHDFEQLDLIYTHLDSSTSATLVLNQSTQNNLDSADVSLRQEWGDIVRRDKKNNPSLYKRDLGQGEKIFTFVLWVK